MGCNCGKPKCKGQCGCKSPAVLQINNPSEYITFHKVTIPASMGDSTTNPPENGRYRNVLVFYEADQTSWLYSTDGIPTKLTNGITNYEDATNLPQINGHELIGNKTSTELGLQSALTAGNGIELDDTEIKAKIGDGLEFGDNGEIDVTNIEQYAHFFDTVAEMQAATNLTAGAYAQTLGYYAVNDGGGAIYKITDQVDLASHQENLGDGLYATLIIDNNADIRQFGVSESNTDNATQLQEAIDKCKVLNGFEGEINVGANITIAHSDFIYDFKKLTVKCTSSLGQFITIESPDTTRVTGELKNLIIDSNAKAQTGLAIYDGKRLNISNILLKGATVTELDVVGGKNTSNSNVYMTNVRCERDADVVATANTTALNIRTNDNVINDFGSVDYKKHIINSGMNWFNMIHCWNWYDVINSVMIETHTQARFDNIYVDTVETGISIIGTNAEQVFVNNIEYYINPNAPDVTGCVPKPFVVDSTWMSTGGRLKVTNGKFGNFGSGGNYLIIAPSYSPSSLHYFNLVNCYTGSYKVKQTWFEYYREGATVSFDSQTALTTPTLEYGSICTVKGKTEYYLNIGGDTATIPLNTNVVIGKLTNDFTTAYTVPMQGLLITGDNTYSIRWSLSSSKEIRVNIPTNATLGTYCRFILTGSTFLSSLPNE